MLAVAMLPAFLLGTLGFLTASYGVKKAVAVVYDKIHLEISKENRTALRAELEKLAVMLEKRKTDVAERAQFDVTQASLAGMLGAGPEVGTPTPALADVEAEAEGDAMSDAVGLSREGVRTATTGPSSPLVQMFGNDGGVLE